MRTASKDRIKTDDERTRIRTAKTSDIAAVMAIETENFGCDAFGEGQFRHAVKSGNAVFAVAETFHPELKTAEISSYAIGYVRTVKTGSGDRKCGRLYSIAVSKKFQGRSLGTKLLTYIEKELGARSCGKIYLEVKNGNTPAIAMYEKFGYSPLGLIQNYYNDGSPAIKFVKELK